MGLESVTYITDLVTTNPEEGDTVGAGNDHFWGVKTGLAGTFAGFTGAAIASTEAQIDAACIPAYHSSSNATDAVANTSYATPATWTEDATAGMTSFVTATGVLTIATTGVYHVSIGFFDVDFDTTSTWYFGLSINGADPTGRWQVQEAQAGSGDWTKGMNISGIVSMTAAQTLELQTKVDANTATFTKLYMTVHRVG